MFQDKMWVMGGQTMPAFGGGSEEFYRDLWNTTDGVKWEKIELYEPCAITRGMIGGNAVERPDLGAGRREHTTLPRPRLEISTTMSGVQQTDSIGHSIPPQLLDRGNIMMWLPMMGECGCWKKLQTGKPE
ncbi:MAG: hypothetical protein R3C11_00920 [Planctomycetaceae bacterium]